MLKKMMVVLGVTAMMMVTCVGCGKEEVNEETETISYLQTVDEAEETSEKLISYVNDLYDDAFKEIYGDDFDMDKLMINDENSVTYEGTTVSWEYVEEVSYNLMTE